MKRNRRQLSERNADVEHPDRNEITVQRIVARTASLLVINAVPTDLPVVRSWRLLLQDSIGHTGESTLPSAECQLFSEAWVYESLTLLRCLVMPDRLRLLDR